MRSRSTHPDTQPPRRPVLIVIGERLVPVRSPWGVAYRAGEQGSSDPALSLGV
jgi:hypothetical protein